MVDVLTFYWEVPCSDNKHRQRFPLFRKMILVFLLLSSSAYCSVWGHPSVPIISTGAELWYKVMVSFPFVFVSFFLFFFFFFFCFVYARPPSLTLFTYSHILAPCSLLSTFFSLLPASLLPLIHTLQHCGPTQRQTKRRCVDSNSNLDRTKGGASLTIALCTPSRIPFFVLILLLRRPSVLSHPSCINHHCDI